MPRKPRKPMTKAQLRALCNRLNPADTIDEAMKNSIAKWKAILQYAKDHPKVKVTSIPNARCSFCYLSSSTGFALFCAMRINGRVRKCPVKDICDTTWSKLFISVNRDDFISIVSELIGRLETRQAYLKREKERKR